MSRVLNAGHNGGVTESTFFHHLKVMDDLDRQKASVMSKIQSAKKAMKDDGVPMKIFDIVRRMRALSAEDLATEMDITFSFMKYMKFPVAQQLSPIDTARVEENLSDMTDEQRAEYWEGKGEVAGKSGANRDSCPYDDPNSLAARHWFTGWEKGQAELAKGIKPMPKEKSSDAGTGKLTGGVAPKHEPEVEDAAKKRGRTKGVTYWHDAEKKKVYEVTSSDADPEGAVSITKKEFEKLKAEYAKADEDDWDNATPSGDSDDEPPAPAA